MNAGFRLARAGAKAREGSCATLFQCDGTRKKNLCTRQANNTSTQLSLNMSNARCYFTAAACLTDGRSFVTSENPISFAHISNRRDILVCSSLCNWTIYSAGVRRHLRDENSARKRHSSMSGPERPLHASREEIIVFCGSA